MFAGALFSLLALALGSGAAEKVESIFEAERFYCGSLSDAHEGTVLDFYRLGELIEKADYIAVVRRPYLHSGNGSVSWCREMYAQDVKPENCRSDGPLIEHGELEFEVAETLRGPNQPSITVRMRSGVRLLLAADYIRVDPKVACRQSNQMIEIKQATYFSPSIVALDPTREYVLTRSLDDKGGVQIAAFALIHEPASLRRDLREALRQTPAEER